jgi:AcrR family transcriptional regulator
MNLRESNKDLNRRKILTAARELMREGGLEALSMRDLAVRAQVSSRTPYNLFGSKTDVLMGLLDEPLQRLWEYLPQLNQRSLLLMALTMVGKVYELYEPDLDYYREIYWGLMSSGHHDVRVVALDRARQLALPMIQQAIENGELKKDTGAEALASQLVLTTAGLLGLWGAGLIDGRELVDHIRRSMGLCFLAHCSETLSRKIRRGASIA